MAKLKAVLLSLVVVGMFAGLTPSEGQVVVRFGHHRHYHHYYHHHHYYHRY